MCRMAEMACSDATMTTLHACKVFFYRPRLPMDSLAAQIAHDLPAAPERLCCCHCPESLISVVQAVTAVPDAGTFVHAGRVFLVSSVTLCGRLSHRPSRAQGL